MQFRTGVCIVSSSSWVSHVASLMSLRTPGELLVCTAVMATWIHEKMPKKSPRNAEPPSEARSPSSDTKVWLAALGLRASELPCFKNAPASLCVHEEPARRPRQRAAAGA
eukprot:s7518_g1.t1